MAGPTRLLVLITWLHISGCTLGIDLHLPALFGSQSGVTKAERRADHGDNLCPLPGSINVAVVAAGFEDWPGKAKVVRSGKVAGSGSDGILTELVTLLKSILLTTQEKVTLYAVTDPTGAVRLKQEVAQQLSPQVSSRCAVVPVAFEPPKVTTWLGGIGVDVNSCPGCPWTMVKAVMYRLLPECVEWAIMVDTDVMFVGDIKEMWAERLKFDARQAVGGVPEANKYNPKYGSPKLPNVMNAGILLCNTNRMREADFVGETLLAADCKIRNEQGCRTVKKENVPFADQSMLALILSAFPHYLYRLPGRWNVQGCGRYGITAADEKKVLKGNPGAFHFTCRNRHIDKWTIVKRMQKKLASTPLTSI